MYAKSISAENSAMYGQPEPAVCADSAFCMVTEQSIPDTLVVCLPKTLLERLLKCLFCDYLLPVSQLHFQDSSYHIGTLVAIFMSFVQEHFPESTSLESMFKLSR